MGVEFRAYTVFFSFFFLASLPDKQRHFQADEREPDACALASGFTGFLLWNLFQVTIMRSYSKY